MYNINNLNIGETLRKYRKIKHLSLEYVGEHIYKTKATISKYEKGEIIPDLYTLLELCNILGINLSSIIPYIQEVYKRSPFPFESNKLYMYYLTENKIIESNIEFSFETNEPVISFYNGIKKDSTYAYFYEGTMEYTDNIIYLNLKNISSKKLDIERVQIIIPLPLSNVSNCFKCFITGLTPNFLPIVKRGIVSTEPIKLEAKHIKKLKISNEEMQNIINNNAWILDSKLYDEFFYDE